MDNPGYQLDNSISNINSNNSKERKETFNREKSLREARNKNNAASSNTLEDDRTSNRLNRNKRSVAWYEYLGY
jgi:hypothetical protein